MRTYSIFILSFLLIAFISKVKAQEFNEFPIGVFIGDDGKHFRYNPDAYRSVDSFGINTVVQYVNSKTKPYLTKYNVLGLNEDNPNDAIGYFAKGYYSKWEAEEQGDPSRTGILHKFGEETIYKNKKCWTTGNFSQAGDSLIYGPSYRQDKNYKLSLVNVDPINYTANFRLALNSSSQLLQQTEPVCELRVIVRYAKIFTGGWSCCVNRVLKDTILKVSDFPSNGDFRNFNLEYGYPKDFYDRTGLKDTTYSEEDADNGIQFQVKWFGKGKLFADYIEVYDNIVWKQYILQKDNIENRIKQYALSYNDSSWANLKYWYACDEPGSLDTFYPIKIVDSLVRSVSSKPIINAFYPPYTIKRNGDDLVKKYFATVNPHRLMIDYYPIWPNDPQREGMEYLRKMLQETHSAQPGFWYVAQGFGEKHPSLNDVWFGWKKPSSKELKSSVMIALAHGVKGVLFWNYWSYFVYGSKGEKELYHDCIVDANMSPTELWFLIKENLAPRLRGVLGKSLLKLNYTSGYLQLKYFLPNNNPPPGEVVHEYLTVGLNQTREDMNWHVGFMEDSLNPSENKYFLMVNLLADMNRSVSVKVTAPVSGYSNYRFRNVEGQFDTTFTTQITMRLDNPAGEGYLYQVAPVAKYGGKLMQDETISIPTTLNDDIEILNGASLYISAEYTANGNITVKKGGKIITSNDGVIIFKNGKKLIVEENLQTTAL